MANLKDSLEQVYSTEVMDVPVGLGGMIFAGNMLSGIVAELLKKIEKAIDKDGKMDSMTKTAIRAAGTAGAAWVIAKYMEDIIGAKTAKLAAAIMVAQGASEIVGGILPADAKGNQLSLIERVNTFVRNMAPGAESTEAANEWIMSDANKEVLKGITATGQGKTGYQGAKNAAGNLLIDADTKQAFAGYDFGAIPEYMPSFAPEVRMKVKVRDLVG